MLKRFGMSVSAIAVAAFAVAAGPAQAGTSISLLFGQVGTPPTASAIQSYSWEVDGPTFDTGDKPKFQEFKLTKQFDANSVLLAQGAARGTVYDKIPLVFSNGPFTVIYCLAKAVVVSDQQSATTADARPTERVSIGYGYLRVQYLSTFFAWDILANKEDTEGSVTC